MRGHSNILWNAPTAVSLEDGSTANLEFNILSSARQDLGVENLVSDPWFRDLELKDFRLAPESAARGSGKDGSDRGARFPVGGMASTPARLSAWVSGPSTVRLDWVDTSDNEQRFVVERSSDAVVWRTVSAVSPELEQFWDSSLTSGEGYHFRIRAGNGQGLSHPSNVIRVQPRDLPSFKLLHQPDTGAELEVEGLRDDTVRIEASADLTTWTPIFHSGIQANQRTSIVDVDSRGMPRRFYRMLVSP